MPVMAWLVLGPVERKKKGGAEGGSEKGRKNGGRVGLAGGEQGQGFVKRRVSFFIIRLKWHLVVNWEFTPSLFITLLFFSSNRGGQTTTKLTTNPPFTAARLKAKVRLITFAIKRK